MKEAFGGTWLMGIVVLFIVLFSTYLAVSVNYTKAFKVKNKIINIIEESEGFNANSESRINEYLKEIGYNTTQINANRCPNGSDSYRSGGYCVYAINTPNKEYPSESGRYWKVTSFIKFEIPIVSVNITIPINGETKVLYYYNDGD